MDYKQALQRAASLCASSEQCWQDIQTKLRKWEVSETDITEIRDYLYKERFLDDERFARGYIRDKSRINKWGRKKIEYMLNLKGISRSVYHEIFQESESEEDTTILIDLLKQKRRSIKAKDAYDEKAKLFRFAAGRGFDSALIQKALKALDIEETDF